MEHPIKRLLLLLLLLRDESHSLLDIIRVKFAYHFRINYDLNLETAEFLELGLCDFGETLFSVRH